MIKTYTALAFTYWLRVHILQNWHEPRKKPWLVGLYRGWNITQLYGDYFINHDLWIPINQPGWLMESRSGFFSWLRWSIKTWLLQYCDSVFHGFIRENPMNKWMIWGYHYFWKHPYLLKIDICQTSPRGIHRFEGDLLEGPRFAVKDRIRQHLKKRHVPKLENRKDWLQKKHGDKACWCIYI